ncbi:hypothetical protein [Neptunitalea lumnitzerae]|uniref:Lipoprotein n=1 Tax=Neptunitalea lumnitzerae TaxID=2965509 RepID=A0ABQ5MEL7_9FLAO|nr:hypothetical protein [Neptunitalea sp. Y10]GLB47796.1 hypothetical protein Y10_01640 [Neptunitalea sp. Y10]
MKKLIIFFTILTAISCSKTTGEEVQTITIKDKYSLTIPKFLKESFMLNQDASLSYENQFKELYVIVLDEDKQELKDLLEQNNALELYPEDLEAYHELCSVTFKDALAEYKEIAISTTEVNNLPAIIQSFSATEEGNEIYYYLGTYESKNTYYQVLTWTLLSSKEKHKAQMEAMLMSLKDLQKI